MRRKKPSTHQDMVQHSKDNTFHGVRPVHPGYPIQHWDRILLNLYRFQLYYPCHSSD